MSLLIIILIVAAVIVFFTGGILLFFLGRMSSFKPGSSIPYHDLNTGRVTWIFPKSMKPAGIAGKVMVRSVGAFMIFNKDMCIDEPYVEKHHSFGKPLFAVSPRDFYVKHVLGNVMMSYDEFQQAKLDLADARLQLEQHKTRTETSIHDEIDKRLMSHFKHQPFIMNKKKSGSSSGGGSFGQNQY